MSTKKFHDANTVLNRIKAAYGIRSDSDLARVLNKDPSTISTWRRRNTFDYSLIFTKFKELNANYLLYGDLPVKRETDLTHPETGEPIGHDLHQSEIVKKIENLPLDPDQKFSLLQTYLNILEQKQRS